MQVNASEITTGLIRHAPKHEETSEYNEGMTWAAYDPKILVSGISAVSDALVDSLAPDLSISRKGVRVILDDGAFPEPLLPYWL